MLELVYREPRIPLFPTVATALCIRGSDLGCLIRIWQKDPHPIRRPHLLSGCEINKTARPGHKDGEPRGLACRCRLAPGITETEYGQKQRSGKQNVGGWSHVYLTQHSRREVAADLAIRIRLIGPGQFLLDECMVSWVSEGCGGCNSLSYGSLNPGTEGVRIARETSSPTRLVKFAPFASLNIGLLLLFFYPDLQPFRGPGPLVHTPSPVSRPFVPNSLHLPTEYRPLTQLPQLARLTKEGLRDSRQQHAQ